MVAAALIAAFACPAQPALLVDRAPGVVRTTVVACDGGRRVVVRRARLLRGRAGRRIVAVAGSGRRVAWGELRHAGGRLRAAVGSSRIARGRARPVEARLVTHPRDTAPSLELVVTTKGQLAWRIGRRVYATSSIGGYAFRVSEAARGQLVLEQDRTVRWWERDGLLGFEDLRENPNAPCGLRPGFRVLAEGGTVVVSDAVYDERVRVLRACVRAELEDPVITQVRLGSRESVEVVGIDRKWIVLNRTVAGPEAGCASVSVELYEAGTSYGGVAARPVPCERAPRRGAPLVAGYGSPVWIVDAPGRSALYIAAGNGVIELDVTGPGGITGLTTDGTVVSWLHDGEARSVRPG